MEIKMGFSAFRHPEYLYQTTTGLFVFRIRIPQDCRPTLNNRRELQYSLKTRCIRTARQLLAPVLQFINGVFQGIQSGVYQCVPYDTLTQTIKDGIRQARSRASPLPYFPVSTPALQPEPIAPEQPQPVKPERPASTFSTIRDAFLKEKSLTGEWRLKTEEDHKQVFSLFEEIFGDIDVEQLTKELMREFKSTIMYLPPNMRKVKKYRDKSIKQILAMKVTDTISSHTINKYLSRLSNLFSYAVSHGYLESNPASGLKVKHKTRPDEERSAYDPSDLKKIFKDLPQDQQPYMRWTPLIALYTGCRLEEICQLHIEDIRQEDGIVVFDINDKGEKHLKTLSSRRLIPMHPHLVEAGLLQYAYDLKAKGEQRLFPELRRLRDGYGQTVSKWFRRYKEVCGISEDKNFHSFRHTFITSLKHTGVDPFMIHELDGHTVDGEYARYGKRFPVKMLLEKAIVKLEYSLYP